MPKSRHWSQWDSPVEIKVKPNKSKPATRGNGEHYYHEVGLAFARVLWLADGRMLDSKVMCSIPVIGTAVSINTSNVDVWCNFKM
jgi:hypothetical protein